MKTTSNPTFGLITKNYDAEFEILRRIPLQNRVQLRLVCRQWRDIVDSQCRGVKGLILFGCRSDYFEYFCGSNWYRTEKKDYQLILNGSINPLTLNPFPNLNSLTVFDHFLNPQLSNLDSLLSNWTESLTSLTIHGLAPSSTLTPTLKSFISLTELNLHFIYDSIDLSTLTPLLAQLTHFSLTRYYGNIVGALSQLGSKLTHLRLDKIQLSADVLKQAYQINSKFTSNVTHLAIGPLCVTDKVEAKLVMDFIGSRFKALEWLCVDFAFQLTKPEIHDSLTKLPHLKVFNQNIL